MINQRSYISGQLGEGADKKKPIESWIREHPVERISCYLQMRLQYIPALCRPHQLVSNILSGDCWAYILKEIRIAGNFPKQVVGREWACKISSARNDFSDWERRDW